MGWRRLACLLVDAYCDWRWLPAYAGGGRRLHPRLRHEVRLRRFVPARWPTLRLLLVSHSAIRTCSYRPLALLDVSVGSPSPSIALGPRSELAPAPLAFAHRAVEHPNPQSFSVVGEIIRAFDRALRADAAIAVYIALHTPQHQLLLASKSHLSLLPVHLVCFRELGTFLEGTLAALVVGPFWISIFLLLHALQLLLVVPHSEKDGGVD